MPNEEISNVIVDFPLGSNFLYPKSAAIDATDTGNNLIVPGISGKKIQLIALVLIAERAVSARFRSGSSGTLLTGQMSLGREVPLVLPWNHLGWFETESGLSLYLELSAAVAVAGCLVYVERLG